MLTLGCMEANKAANLSKVLDLHIDPKQMVVSHTPMRELASIYGGSDRCFTLERALRWQLAHNVCFVLCGE